MIFTEGGGSAVGCICTHSPGGCLCCPSQHTGCRAELLLARVSPGPLRRRARVCAHVRIPPSHMKKPPNTRQTPAKIEKRRSAGRAWKHGRTGGVCGPRVHGQTVPEGPPEASGAQMPPHSREQQGPEAGSELLRPDCGGESVSAENFQGIYEVGETCGFT